MQKAKKKKDQIFRDGCCIRKKLFCKLILIKYLDTYITPLYCWGGRYKVNGEEDHHFYYLASQDICLGFARPS